MAPLEPHGVDSPVPEVGQLVATILSCVLAVTVIAWVFSLYRKERIVWPIYALFSGLLNALMEPFFDMLYGLHFNREGQWTLYTTFGSAQPIWVPICYIAFYGGAAVFVARMLARRPTMKTVWQMYCAIVGMALAAEMTFVSVLGVYQYQDSQPFVVLGYPIFLAFTNAMSAMIGGIIMYRLVPVLNTTLSRLSLITVVPLSFAMGLFGSGILYLSVRHGIQDPPMVLVHFAALTVVGGIAATVRLLGKTLVANAPRSAGVVRGIPAEAGMVAVSSNEARHKPDEVLSSGKLGRRGSTQPR